MPRVEQLYAWVMTDTGPDDEGVPAFLGPDGAWMPMMGADLERAESLGGIVQEMANAQGKSIKLIRSTGVEVVEVIEPEVAE